MSKIHIGNGDTGENEDKLLLEPFTYLTAVRLFSKYVS